MAEGKRKKAIFRFRVRRENGGVKVWLKSPLFARRCQGGSQAGSVFHYQRKAGRYTRAILDFLRNAPLPPGCYAHIDESPWLISVSGDSVNVACLFLDDLGRDAGVSFKVEGMYSEKMLRAWAAALGETVKMLWTNLSPYTITGSVSVEVEVERKDLKVKDKSPEAGSGAAEADFAEMPEMPQEGATDGA